ncbi:MAG: hypothetical protein NC452_06175 [Eubacterium sp.]|nr:hypothetical protein [Eubacterium sp.]
MEKSKEFVKTQTIGKTTYIITSLFNGDNSGTITQKLKRTIEEKIVKSPLKDDENN